MDLITLIIILLVIVVVGLTIRFLVFSGPQKINAHDAEIKALNYILAGEKETALKLLKEIGRKNTSNLGVFLQVGDLYRQLGNPETALKVHLDVLERHGISLDIELMAHERLALDYEALNQYGHAAQHAESILKLSKKNLWALSALHRYAVKQGKWKTAIKAFQKENVAGGVSNQLLPAIYKTQEALQAKTAGKQSEAISLLKQAIKLNSQCATPYYHLGRIRQEEGNYKHAIDFYSTFAELDPTAGSIIFSDIEKMYFELGQFEQVEQFYQRLHKRQPENLEVVIGLANYFERKGEYRDALNLLEEVKNPDYNNLSVILGHLHMLDKLGHKDTLKSAIDDFIAADRQNRILSCPNCDHINAEPSYICDKCGWVKRA
ncbi:MAG: tetratricopeptide repeat protein [Candidatus Marinimicrobia bacterium]|nr:tetratricopeptide repeat protein [Candidatus Neomarinimicrobiota bacterium]